ncbi:MAG: 4Fe-4S dicluster domain-containing protein [Candidatus Krumholzibacteriia bacterium]
MVIDLDRCTGCGDCMVACAVENNVAVPPVPAAESRGLTWMKVYRVGNGRPFPAQRFVHVPIPCQHCEHAPCIHVCPVTAVQLDPETGIVGQIPERCMGCRYCMAACPYHARYFNWYDPIWPEGMEATLNPDVSPRMRGVAEKCNLCHGRLDRARERAAAEGRRELRPGEYVPACAEACPMGAITFGDLLDPRSEVARLVAGPTTFRLLESLGTEPKVYYRSDHEWVRRLGQSRLEPLRAERRVLPEATHHG